MALSTDNEHHDILEALNHILQEMIIAFDKEDFTQLDSLDAQRCRLWEKVLTRKIQQEDQPILKAIIANNDKLVQISQQMKRNVHQEIKSLRQSKAYSANE